MKIVFNMLRCGVGNNGGSRTLIKCAEVLENLGHECNIVSNVDNFTWFEHKKILNEIPTNTDAVINAAAVDYIVTRKCNVPIKIAWWRAHESWSNEESYLRYCYTNKEVKNVVNSIGLQRLLSLFGADSEVVYQGIDFDLWKDRKIRSCNKIRIGCLYTKQLRKRWDDFVKLANILGNDDYEYVCVGNAKPNCCFLTDYIYNEDYEKLCDVYSSCHIWFAPTDSEGLHNVPIEANLCGCLIVCGDEPLNGMIYDYAFSNNTAMVYNRKDIEHAAFLIRNPNWNFVSNMQRYLKDYIGSREDNMIRMIKIIGEQCV